MDRITLKNYRCFGSEEQSARLAPLTLLVGPNSTGKTSFLALIRALWDVAFREVVPNFREHPYDLGSWDDIVYDPGGRRARADYFRANFESSIGFYADQWQLAFDATFANRLTAPYPVSRRFVGDGFGLELYAVDDDQNRTHEGVRQLVGPEEWANLPIEFLGGDLMPARRLGFYGERPIANMPKDFGETVRAALSTLEIYAESNRRPFASAAIRSRPRRTYDPALVAQDGEGDYVPSYLANLARRNADEWQLLKQGLENSGAESELFDEIQVRSFGNSDGDPFQIQVRKHSGPKSRPRKGPWRNLIDVGYGVSQALPVLTELLRPDGPTMFLLQQPEVHLHPQAQAALGTLFCQVAAGGRQLIIETHSDHIIDRVRMDVRDGTTGLRPEDVSILYFEPGDLAVKIHSITIDAYGNLDGAPAGYRQFFSDELTRSIGL
ncbi:MAG: AAA family ATPase [Chloroflexi bacterium]|nr:AAA family ATPase [Chloroflexota bacterium]